MDVFHVSNYTLRLNFWLLQQWRPWFIFFCAKCNYGARMGYFLFLWPDFLSHFTGWFRKQDIHRQAGRWEVWQNTNQLSKQWMHPIQTKNIHNLNKVIQVCFILSVSSVILDRATYITKQPVIFCLKHKIILY